MTGYDGRSVERKKDVYSGKGGAGGCECKYCGRKFQTILVPVHYCSTGGRGGS